MSVASGARTLLGLAPEQQIPGSQIGAPTPKISALSTGAAAPTAVDASVAGLIDGAGIVYKTAVILLGYGEGIASSPSTPAIDLTDSKATVTPEAFADSGYTVLGYRIYRIYTGDAVYKEVATMWQTYTLGVPDSMVYTDNVPLGSEGTRQPRTVSQHSANWGFKFVRPDNATTFDRTDSYFKTTEQTGQLGEPRGLPGGITYTHQLNVPARTGIDVLLSATMFGKPTQTHVSGEPVLIYDFSLSDITADSATLWSLWQKGGDLRPQFFYGCKCGDKTYTLNSKKEIELKAKLMGTADAEMAPGRIKAITGTNIFAPVARGVRMDANRYTDSIFIKIIDAPAEADGIGSFTIKCALDAEGEATPTYGSVTSTVYYDPTTKRQCHPAQIGVSTATSHQSAWVEIFDAAGIAIGADAGENKKPVSVYFPGDCSLLAANDEYEILALAPVPNVYSTLNPTGPGDDGSYTGVSPRFVLTPRFTPAHVTLYKGAAEASKMVFSFQGGALKVTRPMDSVEALGPEAANPVDVDVFGKISLEIDIDRRLQDRGFERAMKEDTRFYVEIRFEGERIPIDSVAGTVSTYRELVLYKFYQVRVDKSDSPLSGDKAYTEKLKLMVEQPDDSDLPVMTHQIVTADGWDLTNI